MDCRLNDKGLWAPSQYPERRLSVRSRKVSKPRDLYLELSDCFEIWQALRQQCCRCACQISKRYDKLKYQSRGFETLRDRTKRRLFGYWDGAQYPRWIRTCSSRNIPISVIAEWLIFYFFSFKRYESTFLPTGSYAAASHTISMIQCKTAVFPVR